MLRSVMQILKEDRGIGVVEMILILVVLIGLVIIFQGTADQSGKQYFQDLTTRSGTI